MKIIRKYLGTILCTICALINVPFVFNCTENRFAVVVCITLALLCFTMESDPI